MSNITKQSLIQDIAKSTGFVRNDIKTVIEQFLDLLDEAIDGGHRVLVFSQFVSMLTILRRTLDAASNANVWNAHRLVA